jgi:hypothetical protein
MSVHFRTVCSLVANDDGGQGWIIANIPYKLTSVIAPKPIQLQIRTELHNGSVTTSRDGLEARVDITVRCGKRKTRRKTTATRALHTPPHVHVLRTEGLQKAEAA